MDATANICILSANGKNITVVKALKAGAKHYLVKPFGRETIIDTINKMLPINL